MDRVGYDEQDVALSALLHDIGKVVQRYKTEVFDISPKERRSHAYLGYLYIKRFFSEAFTNAGFHTKYVLEGIKEHHSRFVDQSSIVWFVKWGDWLAAASARTSEQVLGEEEEADDESASTFWDVFIKKRLLNPLTCYEGGGVEYPIQQFHKLFTSGKGDDSYEMFHHYLTSISLPQHPSKIGRYFLLLNLMV